MCTGVNRGYVSLFWERENWVCEPLDGSAAEAFTFKAINNDHLFPKGRTQCYFTNANKTSFYM